MYQLEDIVYSKSQLYVRGLLVHHHGVALVASVLPEVAREIEDVGGVTRLEWVVLVGKVAPQQVHSNHFAPLQSAKQWYAVEYLSVQVPLIHHREVSVVEELKVADE